MVARDFEQQRWDEHVTDDCRQLVRLAVREDLGRLHDWTTLSLVPASARGAALVVTRQAGVIAGLPAGEVIFDEMNLDATWQPLVNDGDAVAAGTPIARAAGAARDLLTAERLTLNLLGRLCGVASLTRRYVDEVHGTRARVYDTRKTTPGFRRLEKYAVRCGGGNNHRRGLYDAVLIKDNHLALQQGAGGSGSPRAAVDRARSFLKEWPDFDGGGLPLIEIEVDNLDQLREALLAEPDLILLDNMTIDQLREAVRARDASGAAIELEASGGVSLSTVGPIARSGVERISVGALTHAAAALDLGLDWER